MPSLRKLDLQTTVLVLALLGCGLLAVSSAATHTDFDKQAGGVLLSLIPLAAVWALGRERLHALSPWLYAVSLALLLLTALVGREVNGNRNWLALGPLQLQPVEIAKLGLIFMLARVMRGGYRGAKSYLAPLAVFGAAFALVATHDFGDAMVLAAIFLGTLIAFRAPWWHLALLLVGVAVLAPTVVYPHLKPYQRARLTSFVDPTRDARGSGYQVVQAMIAEGSGGFMGKGYGRGTQVHKGFVYSQQSDFIFASWAEEQGFVGCVLLLSLYAALLWRLSTLGAELPVLQDQVVAAGVTAWIGTQATENIGAAISLLPLTGITLPLVSYGLTSLVMVLTALGCVLVLYRDRSVGL